MSYLTNGLHVLVNAVDVPIANISPPENSGSDGIYLTPFTVGVMGKNGETGPGNLLGAALRGDRDWQLTRGRGEGTGAEHLHVAIGHPGKPKHIVYEFDPTRGCLPVIFSGCYAGTTTRAYVVHVTEITSCSNQRWFPKRIVLVNTPDAEQKTYPVETVEVVELDVDAPPPDDQLVMKLPRGTRVSEPGNNDSNYAVVADEHVSVNDLSKVLDRCRLNKTQGATTIGIKTPPSQHRKYVFWGLSLVGVALIGIGYRVIARRNQKAG
jgi:hypothetical protein